MPGSEYSRHSGNLRLEMTIMQYNTRCEGRRGGVLSLLHTVPSKMRANIDLQARLLTRK